MLWRYIVETSDCWLKRRRERQRLREERIWELLSSAGLQGGRGGLHRRCGANISSPPPSFLLRLESCASVCPTKLCILLGRANSGAIIISKVRLGPCKKTSEKGEKANEMGECDIYIYSRVNKGWWEWSRLPSMHLFRARAIALSSGGLCLPGASVFRGLNF